MSAKDDYQILNSGETLISAIHAISQKIMRMYSQAVFKETGLNWQDWRILRAAVSLQSCRAQDICTESGMQKPHVSNGLSRLEKAGHIQRIKNPDHARSKLVISTEQGQSLVKNAQPALNELDNRLSTTGSDGDAASVLQGLRVYEDELGRLANASKPELD